ncbi:MAG: hypothetical protein U1F25_01615 [Rubrivivax sp.]
MRVLNDAGDDLPEARVGVVGQAVEDGLRDVGGLVLVLGHGGLLGLRARVQGKERLAEGTRGRSGGLQGSSSTWCRAAQVRARVRRSAMRAQVGALISSRCISSSGVPSAAMLPSSST